MLLTVESRGQRIDKRTWKCTFVLADGTDAVKGLELRLVRVDRLIAVCEWPVTPGTPLPSSRMRLWSDEVFD